MDDPLIRFTDAKGRAMVMVPADIYDRLRALAMQALAAAPPPPVTAAIAAGKHPIAAWRAHRGLSQHALAAAAGVSRVWISRIEMGAGHGTATTRARIALALGVTVAMLEG
ncbi:MAG TPA: helix-turn-helix transcriptional regulator [Sphingomonas sp.]|jgi:DNA-binding XRE family transcriptional regulator|uniref:helix-turn-helix domain-containing protein n=1 Tax=Sphingomonas sp. TaxID=28214 RepID=UPI002ED7F4ED